MIKLKTISLAFAVWIAVSASAQKETSEVNEGNRLYKKEKYTEAEIAYRKAIVKNNQSVEGNYNLGNALYKQGKFDEALKQYQTALPLTDADKERKASVLHNMGNSLLSQKKIEESVKAYQMALKANPKDNDTRYNLAFAMAMLKKQQQNDDNKKKNNKNDKNPDEDLNGIKARAEQLVSERKYQEAYDLMKDAEKKYPDIKKYADFTKRIYDIIQLNR